MSQFFFFVILLSSLSEAGASLISLSYTTMREQRHLTCIHGNLQILHLCLLYKVPPPFAYTHTCICTHSLYPCLYVHMCICRNMCIYHMYTRM